MSYKEALRHATPLVVAHLFVRLVSAAVIVPVIGLLLAVTLSFSDQSALTDQDIARFLFTPAGAIGGLSVCALIIAAAVVDVTFMSAVFRSGQWSVAGSLQTGTGFLIAAFPRLVRFSVELLLRVTAISAPFLIVAAIPAALLLRDFDINYYLANWPPVFLGTVGFAAACFLALALVLLERFSAWALALHYVVFDRVPSRHAFRISRQKMLGHRLHLTRKVVAWAVIRFVLASALVMATGFLFAEIPHVFGDNFRLLVVALAFLTVLWAFANAAISAVANGALADLLNDEFDRSLEARPARVAVDPAPKGSAITATPVTLVILSVASLLFGGAAFNTIGSAEEVEVIGHRGAAAARPENTMAAVLKAIEDGADWVEIDVQETADGEIVVTHDSDFMKAAGNPLKVWDATMDDIAKIDVGSWFDPVYAAERVPTLRDVLSAVKDRSKVIIELKYYGHDVDLENRVVALVEEAGMQDQIATMSLKYPAVRKMLQLRPEWRTGVLAATSVGKLSGLEGDFLAVSASNISGRLLRQAELAGKDVYVWTVNTPAMMSRMISLGVDGLITDEPAQARAVIEYHKSLSTFQRFMLRLGDRVGYAFDMTPEEGGEM
ncbi:MAG: glycerophosphodiester phosphodiesterase [Roseobacter sp.]